MEQSTRRSIVEYALADVEERLEELPPTGDAESLRALARQYATEMERWEKHPPDESRRVALLKSVLDLNVDVMRAGSQTSKAADEVEVEVVEADLEDDLEDEYPKSI